FSPCLFFFNDTATTEIYTLSLHDALPISRAGTSRAPGRTARAEDGSGRRPRSEEHTCELQSRLHLVCRLLIEKQKKNLLAGIMLYIDDTLQVRMIFNLII